MPEADTELLAERAVAGDADLRNRLLDRLRRMVVDCADSRRRDDRCDVVQESLAQADRKLKPGVRSQPLPFFPSLRRLADDGTDASLHFATDSVAWSASACALDR